MTVLSEGFLRLPIAHRALHDVTKGRPENSLPAIRAAISSGYAIEIDVQLSRDARAMVFHDYSLERLTPENGAVRQRTAQELSKVPLLGSSQTIPTLRQVLKEIGGRVPLLVEIKDQDGALGPDVGALEQAVAEDIADSSGEIAVMSFNPHSVAAMHDLAPDLPRGLTTDRFLKDDWKLVPASVLERLRSIPDFEAVRACFLSHESGDLKNPRVQEIRAGGSPVLCWTIRDAAAEKRARRLAGNITFEGYYPTIPAPA